MVVYLSSLTLVITHSDFQFKLNIDPAVIREEHEISQREVVIIETEMHVVMHGVVGGLEVDTAAEWVQEIFEVFEFLV